MENGGPGPADGQLGNHLLSDHHRRVGLGECTVSGLLRSLGHLARLIECLWSRFVFASVGYGPAVALYIVFGCFAGFSGWILWKVFLELDSTRYPLINFGDTYYRVFGPWARHLVNVGQSLQLLMSVSVLILGNGQTLSQLANNKVCFVVCMVIMMIIGMVFGSIRSLQRLGWLTNAAVWLNIADFIMM